MKWFKLMGNYKPFWNNLSENIPTKHIEDIVKELNKDYNTTWEPIKNKVELKDLSTCGLYSDFKSMPNYLKMVNDDGTPFYFYLIDYTQIMGNKNGLNFLATYELDRYMTIYYGKLQTLLNNRVNVLHLFKYCDRYNWDNDKKAININLLNMPQFNNSLNVFNFNYIRKPLIGFTSKDIYNNNFNAPIPAELKLYSWNPTVRNTWNCWIKTDFLNQPNKNKRYRYLVAKASALIDNLNYDITWQDAQHTPTFSADAKIIIPIPDKMTLKMGEEPKVPAYMDITNKTLLNAFNAFDIKQTNDLTVSPLGNNFIGSYECDIPYSVWYGLSLREPDKVGFKFGYNKGVPYDEKTKQPTNDLRIESVPIVFFIIDSNYAPRIKLINNSNDNNNNTLTNKINHIIKNIDKWLPETEPTLLTPLYYKEVYKQDNDASIETNLSYLDLTINEAYNGFNTYAYLCYDSTLNIAYDYDKNNNELNSYWNNSNSNLRNDINLSLGVYSSSATNYYNENSTAIITGIKNNAIEKAKLDAETGKSAGNWFSNIIGGIGSFFMGNPFSGTASMMGSTINNAVNIFKQRKQIEQNNMSLASNIKNIQTGTSTTLINPYIAGTIPNKNINNKPLFNIYSNELNEWDKNKVFSYVLEHGYPFNSIAPINDYDNRQYMNILHIDTSTMGDAILNLLINKETNLFNNLTYNNAFLTWLNQKHKVYKTAHLINVTDFMGSDYIHNVENDINLINIKNINDIIKNIPDKKLLFNNNTLIATYSEYTNETKLLAKATIRYEWVERLIREDILKNNPNITKAFLDNCTFKIFLNESREWFDVTIKSNTIIIRGEIKFKQPHNNIHIGIWNLKEKLLEHKQYLISVYNNTKDYMITRNYYNLANMASRFNLIEWISGPTAENWNITRYNFAKNLLIYTSFNTIHNNIQNITIKLAGPNIWALGDYQIKNFDLSLSCIHIKADNKNLLIKPSWYKYMGNWTLTYHKEEWNTQDELTKAENIQYRGYYNGYMLYLINNNNTGAIFQFKKNYVYIEGFINELPLKAIKPIKKPLYYHIDDNNSAFESPLYYNYYNWYTFYSSAWFNNLKNFMDGLNYKNESDIFQLGYLTQIRETADWVWEIPYDKNKLIELLKIQDEYDKRDKTDIKKLQEK